jgi:hypothetical protein
VLRTLYPRSYGGDCRTADPFRLRHRAQAEPSGWAPEDDRASSSQSTSRLALERRRSQDYFAHQRLERLLARAEMRLHQSTSLLTMSQLVLEDASFALGLARARLHQPFDPFRAERAVLRQANANAAAPTEPESPTRESAP